MLRVSPTVLRHPCIRGVFWRVPTRAEAALLSSSWSVSPCYCLYAYSKFILTWTNAIILQKIKMKTEPIMFHWEGIGVIYSCVEQHSISVIAFNYDWYVSAHQSITNCHYVILLSLI